jgi:CheY-like chemotaxis protein
VGYGTTIKIYLPQAQHAVAMPHEITPTHPATLVTSRLILIVEDNQEMLALTSAMVESLGYRILQAETGEAALDILNARDDIDLLLTDVMLPGVLNGPVLAERAVVRHPRLKVLFNSGYAEHAIKQSGILEGNVHLISKPFRKQELADKLEEVFSAVA